MGSSTNKGSQLDPPRDQPRLSLGAPPGPSTPLISFYYYLLLICTFLAAVSIIVKYPKVQHRDRGHFTPIISFHDTVLICTFLTASIIVKNHKLGTLIYSQGLESEFGA